MVRVKTAVQSEFKGIFFDYGGVIEDLASNEDSVRKGISAIQGILERRGVVKKTDVLAKMVKSGHEAYEKWYGNNAYRELPSGEIWSAFLLKEICADTPASGCDGESMKSIISAMGEELGSVYEYHLFKRRVARDLKAVLMTLFYSGFVLSIVSNTMSFGASIGYKPPNPERTARKPAGWGVTFQEWSNRKAMAKSIRMQERGMPSRHHWKAVVPLTDGEGY